MDSISVKTTNHYLFLILLPSFLCARPPMFIAERVTHGVLYSASYTRRQTQQIQNNSVRGSLPRVWRHHSHEQDVSRHVSERWPSRLEGATRFACRPTSYWVYGPILRVWGANPTINLLYHLPSPIWFEIFSSSTSWGQLTTCFANPRSAV